jgi:hypothetical protein
MALSMVMYLYLDQVMMFVVDFELLDDDDVKKNVEMIE